MFQGYLPADDVIVDILSIRLQAFHREGDCDRLFSRETGRDYSLYCGRRRWFGMVKIPGRHNWRMRRGINKEKLLSPRCQLLRIPRDCIGPGQECNTRGAWPEAMPFGLWISSSRVHATCAGRAWVPMITQCNPTYPEFSMWR